MTAEKVYLGFGGNLGDVTAAFQQALHSISCDQRSGSLRTSSIYRTSPWGNTDQPHFLNSVVEFSWYSSLESLVQLTEQLEMATGRKRSSEQHWGPRPLDIDILLFGERNEKSGEVTVPHPRMHLRRFVLQPLAELNPDIVPPGWTLTVSEMLKLCSDNGIVEKVHDSARTIVKESRDV